jgi:hypothetical protein
MSETASANANLDLIKSFICTDGKPYSISAVTNANKLDIENMVKTRDPRFEATFWYTATPKATASALYTCKFIDRIGPEQAVANNQDIKYTGSYNDNDAPVMRYAELLLNWIEAKAELATLGGTAVNQSDIETSINKIRNRPLDAAALSRGVTKTAPMDLSSLPDDPNRDPDVPALIWEIRRERRMELFGEYSRLVDLRRWKKIHYMDDTQNPDLLKGMWVNIPVELPDELRTSNVGKLAIVNESGEKIVYDGTNSAQMVGYYSPATVMPRRQFMNISGINVYLAPVGTNQRIDYRNKGYVLDQTEGWSNILPE